VRRSAVIS